MFSTYTNQALNMSTTSSTPPRETTESPESDDDTLSRCPTPDPQVLETYTTLMASLLPPARGTLPQAQASTGTQPDANPSVDDETEAKLGRPMTKAEKQNAKKKRRKEREREEKAEQVRAEREERERVEMERPVCECCDVSSRYESDAHA
jgi:hypothetical protein